jgi:hypothetical protein
MFATMNATGHDAASGDEQGYNPYAPPRTGADPSATRPPASAFSPQSPGAISVTHDLSDHDLKRFVDCDVFYDPQPFLGFIPQWLWFFAMVAGLAYLLSIPTTKSRALSAGGAALVVVMTLFSLLKRCGSRRNIARQLGLCKDRTITITPAGLAVTIPAVSHVSRGLATVGPVVHPWGDIRKVTERKDYLIFWLEGRYRVVLPMHVFTRNEDAFAFVESAKRWHADVH